MHDLPPVSGSIIWARQIERQLSAYMRRVEDVLGKGWENHVDGQKLKADGESFRYYYLMKKARYLKRQLNFNDKVMKILVEHTLIYAA